MAPSTTMIQSLLLAAASSVVAAASANSNSPPSTGQEWVSLHKNAEFQPAAAADDASPTQQRALRQAQERFLEEQTTSPEQQTSYVDSQETYYDAYAQAWRYVGFYTDCNPAQGDRRLQEGEESACARYLIWAAYVDLGYSGKGIGEYQFFDTYSEEWDTSACETTGNVNEDGTIDERSCKKMDCHMPDSKTWQLMGYFKEVEYTEWFEQLFKHEGYCVWQENEYDFMYENYGAWPEGCAETEVSLSDGTSLYYDTKALPNATMTYGLYTDARCSVDYTGDEVTLEQLLNDGDGEGLSFDELEYWNNAMEIYRVCQPCRSYALNEYGDKNRKKRRQLEDDPNNGLFQCDDAAGYTNVNQCMKFRTKTDMAYASLNEVMEAAQQGGITSLTVDGLTYGEYRAGSDVVVEEEPNWNILWIGIAVLTVGLANLFGALFWVRTKCRRQPASLNEPLITDL